ncbi:MAG: LytTR family DNA-binding domain-containing protein [Gammaproteobacteria bacterium]|nr:MAG: LytTR family DNA-binding domain-containing protein [Gammaproteobacteria bacterium]
MRILIADDETLARSRVHSLLGEIGGHDVVAEAANGEEVIEAYNRVTPDLILLDIRMPVMDGMEAAQHLSMLESPPAVIFTTAYGEHALRAFELHAVDYLLKPIRKARLEEALASARSLNKAQLAALKQDQQKPYQRSHISVCSRGNVHLIPVANIIYFLAEQKYITVRHTGGEDIIEDSLKSLENEFGDNVLRIHRNALLATAYLEGLEKSRSGQSFARLKGCEQRLDVSRRHVAEVRRQLKRRCKS